MTKASRKDQAVAKAASELVVVQLAGEGPLPKRSGGRAINRTCRNAASFGA